MTKASCVWVRAPRGPIPKAVQDALRARLEKYARTKWKGRCRGVVVRFRGAYVDAFPLESPHMPWTTSDQRARIDTSPTRLCRLGYLGSLDQWQYAFYKYSDEKYALSVVASGSSEATPEQAFACAAGVYLQE